MARGRGPDTDQTLPIVGRCETNSSPNRQGPQHRPRLKTLPDLRETRPAGTLPRTIKFETVTSDGTSTRPGRRVLRTTQRRRRDRWTRRAHKEGSIKRCVRERGTSITFPSGRGPGAPYEQAPDVHKGTKPPPEERPVFQGKPTYIDGSTAGWLHQHGGHEVAHDRSRWCKAVLGRLPEGLQTIGDGPKDKQSRGGLFTPPTPRSRNFAIVGIPDDIIPALLERGRKMAYMLGTVYVRFEVRKGRFSYHPTPAPAQSTPEGNTRMDAEAPTPVANTVQEPSSPASTLLHESEGRSPGQSTDCRRGTPGNSSRGWTGGLEELNLSTGEDGEESPLI
ncbi:hypothetical protein ACJJTC_011437 [Scirpophaga incertulas]